MGKQPTTGQKKSKESIARAALAVRKGAKKKWTKGKVKDKLNNAVLLDPKQFKEVEKELPRMKLITLSTVVDRFKVVASVARQLIRYFHEQGKIKALDFQHQQCPLFTSFPQKDKPEGAVAEEKETKKGAKGKPAPKDK